MSTTYATRSNARRAACAACRRVIGPAYQAAEGPDYLIHPVTQTIDEMIAGRYRDRFKFELRGPVHELLTILINAA